MEATVQVSKRGVLTLPNTIRKKYDIREGETFRIVDVDGVLILTPLAPMVAQLAREIERARIVPDPAVEELQPYTGCAHPEDLSILVAAAQAQTVGTVATGAVGQELELSRAAAARPSAGSFID